jgi:hypothetical protein
MRLEILPVANVRQLSISSVNGTISLSHRGLPAEAFREGASRLAIQLLAHKQHSSEFPDRRLGTVGQALPFLMFLSFRNNVGNV